MINLYDLLEAADGQLFGEAASQLFTDFCFDSRRAQEGEIFVALKTASGDGHDYMEDAVKRGVTGIICNKPPRFSTENITVVVTRDVERALIRWAELILGKFGTTVIAVTGSTGKSTTKEAIAAVLGTKFNVYKSPGSFNGRFGLPVALGKLRNEHQLAVLEFGIDQFGEMEDMAKATKPTIGVMTNIGHTHLDRFGAIENVAAEKRILLEHLPENGIAILNFDDPLVRDMVPHTPASVMTLSVDTGSGSSFGADLIAYNLVVGHNKTGFDLRFGDQRYVGKWTPLLGAHQLYAVLNAVALGLCFEIPIETSLRALTELEPLPGRMRSLKGINDTILVDDSYSANLESTLCALDWLGNFRTGSRKVYAVIGDIGGLGSQAVHSYREIGRKLGDTVDGLITKGEFVTEIERSAQESGLARTAVHSTYSPRDAALALKDTLNPGDIVLVKGSTASRMERVSQEFLADIEDSQYLPRQEAAFRSVWLDRPARPTWLNIDMDAVAYNVRRLKMMVGDQVALMAVVKANAYGHGAIPVSTTALLNGAEYLGVASINEAIELREGGIDAPILILGYTPAWAASLAIRYDITVTLYDVNLARLFDRMGREMNATVKAHIKVDTGMGRLGILPDDSTAFFRALHKMENIEIEGIFTHFSVADEDSRYTIQQIGAFNKVVRPLVGAGFAFKYIHAANSAGILNFPEAHFTMVRAGIAMHGLNPSKDVPVPDDFKPALSWKTTIAQVKTLKEGSFVGYGNTYQTLANQKIAVIPVGYADGFRRSPRNWGEVLVQGQRAPLVGRVSMDQTMIDVTHIEDVKIGDEVILIGTQGDEHITATEAAHKLGTVNYELVSTILARVPRVK